MIISKGWTVPANLKLIKVTEHNCNKVMVGLFAEEFESIIRYVTGVTLTSEVQVDIENDQYLRSQGGGEFILTIERKNLSITPDDYQGKQLETKNFDLFIGTFNHKRENINIKIEAMLVDTITKKPTTIDKVL